VAQRGERSQAPREVVAHALCAGQLRIRGRRRQLAQRQAAA